MVCSSSVIWNHAGLDTATGHKLTQVSTQPQVSRLDLARTDQDADTFSQRRQTHRPAQEM